MTPAFFAGYVALLSPHRIYARASASLTFDWHSSGSRDQSAMRAVVSASSRDTDLRKTPQWPRLIAIQD